jgi:hypothetical protein
MNTTQTESQFTIPTINEELPPEQEVFQGIQSAIVRIKSRYTSKEYRFHPFVDKLPKNLTLANFADLTLEQMTAQLELLISIDRYLETEDPKLLPLLKGTFKKLAPNLYEVFQKCDPRIEMLS